MWVVVLGVFGYADFESGIKFEVCHKEGHVTWYFAMFIFIEYIYFMWVVILGVFGVADYESQVKIDICNKEGHTTWFLLY